MGLGGVQLLRSRHRQHGAPASLRNAGAARALAESAAQGRDPLVLRHDRARFVVVGRDQHLDPHRARRRLLGHQRAQVVHHRGAARALQGGHRHGRHQPQRGAPSPPEHGARPHGRARGQGRAQHQRDESSRAGGPQRGRVPRRARPEGEPPRRRGQRLRAGAGAPRARDASTTACARSASASWRSN